MKRILNVAIVTMACFTIQAGAFYVTSRPVQVAPQLNSLLELVTGDINYRYTDTTKRLTAIKDKDLDSCFVTNYDPQWNLYKTEKESISRRKPFETVKSTTDFVKLRRKAGRVIAHMCKRVKIFWLNKQQNRLLPPPMLPGNQGQGGLRPPPLLTGNNGNPGQSGILPPPLPLAQRPSQAVLQPPPQLIPGTDSNKQGGSSAIISPPALPKENIVLVAQNQNQAPPMISNSKDSAQAPPLLLSGDSANMPPVLNQNSAQNIDTPPPLALWLQMQHDKTQPPAPPLLSGQSELVEPPQLQNNENVAPPKIPMGNIRMASGQSRAQRNLKVEDLQAPPTKSSRDMIEPLLPDLRTPPSPFENRQP